MSNVQNFENLYNDNYTKISSYCYFLLKNSSEAEDVVSETFFRAYQNVTTGKKIEKAWLYTVARNLIYNKFKSVEYKNKIRNNEFYEMQPDNIDIEKESITKESYQQFLKLLSELPKDQKEAVSLRYIQEFEYVEIALIMTRSTDAVKNLVSKGLKRLKIENDKEKKIQILPLFFTSSSLLNSQSSILNQIQNNLFINHTAVNALSTIVTLTTGKIIALLTTTAVVAAAAAGGTVYLATNTTSNSSNQSNVQTTSTLVPITSTVANSITTTAVTTTTATLTTAYDPTFDISFKLPAGWKSIVVNMGQGTCSSMSSELKDPSTCPNNGYAKSLMIYNDPNYVPQFNNLNILINFPKVFFQISPLEYTEPYYAFCAERGSDCGTQKNIYFKVIGKNIKVLYEDKNYTGITFSSLPTGQKSVYKIFGIRNIAAVDAENLNTIKQICESITY